MRTVGAGQAGGQAGGSLSLRNKGCALDPSSSYFGFPIAETFHVWGSYRRIIVHVKANDRTLVILFLLPLLGARPSPVDRAPTFPFAHTHTSGSITTIYHRYKF